MRFTNGRRGKPTVLPGLRIAAKLAHMNPITTARPGRADSDEPLDACVEWPSRPGAVQAPQKATICPVAFLFSRSIPSAGVSSGLRFPF